MLGTGTHSETFSGEREGRRGEETTGRCCESYRCEDLRWPIEVGNQTQKRMGRCVATRRNVMDAKVSRGLASNGRLEHQVLSHINFNKVEEQDRDA